MGTLQKIFREFSIPIAMLLTVLGILCVIFGLFGVFYKSSPEWVQDISYPIYESNMYLWLTFLGPFVLIGGIWLLVGTIRKSREFEELMETTSKSRFVRNLDRVEYLAWCLSSRHEQRVYEKKKELKIKN